MAVAGKSASSEGGPLASPAGTSRGIRPARPDSAPAGAPSEGPAPPDRVDLRALRGRAFRPRFSCSCTA
eukprot:1624225-Alexandrium_andersonii.AAC.1